MLIRWQLSAHVLTTLSFLCSTAWSRSAPRQIFDDDESRYAYGQSGDDGSVAGDTEPNGPYERLDMFSLLPTQDEVLQAIDSPEVNVAAESLNALNIP